MKIYSVITTKNRLSFFERALQSVLEQTRKSDHIIVVSDSEEYIKFSEKTLADQVVNIEFLENRYTKNYAGSLNTAINHIIEKEFIKSTFILDDIYIAFLDDDDLWRDSYLSACSQIAREVDFVVTGLIRKTSTSKDFLSIPTSLDVDDFLKGNPHIQGSNTFIKLTTLLRAGCFDENLPSTTDRDLFVRTMMLEPQYEIIKQYLVEVNASDNRPRITNTSLIKKEGLKKFYYKYSGLMSQEVKNAFFERCKNIFGVDRDEFYKDKKIVEPIRELDVYKSYLGSLTVGIIITEYDLGIRLIRQLASLKRNNLNIVIIANFMHSLEELMAFKGEFNNFYIITLDQIKKDFNNGLLYQFFQNFDYDNVITDISVARSTLNYYLYNLSKEGYIWILDDDMELKEYVVNQDRIFEKNIDIDSIIAQYHNSCDAVVGGYSNDAPLPMLSILRKNLLDYTYSQFSILTPFFDHEMTSDYYYDLSDFSRQTLETPMKLLYGDIDSVFSGKATSRPLYSCNTDSENIRGCGGNTLIFNKELLLVPNISINILGVIARRGDYFWVQQAKTQGFKLIAGAFSLKQTRKLNKFDLNREVNKFLKDIAGASFTKAHQELIDLSINSSKRFAERYQHYYKIRLTLFILSLFRIQGLLQVLNKYQDVRCFSENFSVTSILSVIKFLKEYISDSAINTAHRNLLQSIKINNHLANKIYIEKCLTEYFQCERLRFLGVGSEGVIYTDFQYVYKYFWNIPKKMDFLEQCGKLFEGKDYVYGFSISYLSNHIVLKYAYEPIKLPINYDVTSLVGIINFCQQHKVVFNNIKKTNFVQVSSGLKFIDYGGDIVPLTKENFQRMKERIYQMIKYDNISEQDFKELITDSYSSKVRNDILSSGIESLDLLLKSRSKEEIHDEIIYKLINDIKPKKILDYGAGKCKIANQLSTHYSISVYDIDQDTLQKRSNNRVNIVQDIKQEKDQVYNLINSNLVLCSIDNESVIAVMMNIARLLEQGGYFIFSICNPLFNSVKHTETRCDCDDFNYTVSQSIQKTLNISIKGESSKILRVEHHRPIEYYWNLMRKFGFQILEIFETTGVDYNNLLPIAEHLVFKCRLNIKFKALSDMSLLIKTNPMEYRSIYSDIQHIVSQLEQGVGFKEKIVIVDDSDKNDRARRYQNDNKKLLIQSLEQAVANSLIDKIVYSPSDIHTVRNLSEKYFNIYDVNSEHSQNGQAIFATLYGFESIQTRFVLQTDSDMLYHCSSPIKLQQYFSLIEQSPALTSTFSIANNPLETTILLGQRVEVRSSIIDLNKLSQLLPLDNDKDHIGILSLPWHRSLDQKILKKACSERFSDHEIFYIHPENSRKNINNLLSIVRSNLEQNKFWKGQVGEVNLVGELCDWVVKTNHKVVVFIRGYNTSAAKLKRLFDSLIQQSVQNFQIIYIDDASTDIESKDYAFYRLSYSNEFKYKPIVILNEVNKGGLYNLNFAMSSIVQNEDAVIICIDNDDYLINDNAIKIITEKFDEGFEIVVGGCFRKDKPLKKYSVASFDRVYNRNGDNIWLHPKCFKKYLYSKLNLDDLKINGEFVRVNEDFAMMLPMVEISKKNMCMEEVLYYFEPSVNNQNGQGEYASDNKKRIKDILLNRARKRNEESYFSDR